MSSIGSGVLLLLLFQVGLHIVSNSLTSANSDLSVVTSSIKKTTLTGQRPLRLSARLLAANVIKMIWLPTGNSTSCIPSDNQHAENMADMVTCLNSSETLVALQVVDLANCAVTSCRQVSASCVIGVCDVTDSLSSCVIWDSRRLSTDSGYLLCIGVRSTTWSRTTPRWFQKVLRSQTRRPPLIEKCTIETNGNAGHRVVIEDMSVTPVTVTLVDNDELRVWCEVLSSPSPWLSWYHNGATFASTTNHSAKTLAIHSAKPQHNGKYILEAVNQYGKSFSAVFNIQFTELQRFPSNEQERKYTVKIGDGARLECRYLYRSHDLIFHWSKMTSARDQHPVHIVPDDRVVIGLDGSLMFVNTVTNDTGLYMCRVSNAVLDRSVYGSPLKLEIDSTGSPDFHRVPQLMWNTPSVATTLVGSVYAMQCVFSGKPTPQITWYTSDYEQSAISESSSHYRLSDGNHTLTIINVTSLDQRVYSCAAVNSEGSNYPPLPLELTVNELPKFIRKPSSLNATVGETVTFHCSATGNPPPRIDWQINGLPVSGSSYAWSYSAVGREALVIQNVTLSDNFIVQCNISNYLGVSVVASASLVVYLPTTITTAPLDVILSDDRHVVEFGCEVSSDPSTAVDIVWLRGDRPVSVDGQRIYVSSVDQTLVINVTDEEDHGRSFVATYTCRATNGLTIDSRQARLRPPPSTSGLGPSNNDTLSVTGSATTTTWTWTLFGLSLDVTSLSCILTLLFVILVLITVVLVLRCRRRRKAKVIEEFRSLEQMTSSRSEHFEMRRWTRPTDSKSSTLCGSDLVCENRLVVGLSAIEDSQLKKALQSMYIPRDTILLGDTVGRGQFGRVYSASMRLDSKREQQVAVKTMKYKPEEKEMIEPFLHEAMLMRDFQHLNVLGIVGITFDPDGSPMVVLPYMANGDLRRYVMNADLDITVLRLLKMALQVGYGMTYLSDKRFVHRDLAARNCIVDAHGVVKVADFGLSRELILHDYYRLSHNRTPVPVRWMAPESLDLNVFTTMSDVWSFGVLMWELITRGAEPYTDIENWEVANYVKTGKRLPQPLYCPDSVFRIMMTCWRVDAHLRPTFTEICADIEFIVNSANGQPPLPTSPRTMDDAAAFYSNHVGHSTLLYRNSDAGDAATA